MGFQLLRVGRRSINKLELVCRKEYIVIGRGWARRQETKKHGILHAPLIIGFRLGYIDVFREHGANVGGGVQRVAAKHHHTDRRIEDRPRMIHQLYAVVIVALVFPLHALCRHRRVVLRDFLCRCPVSLE